MGLSILGKCEKVMIKDGFLSAGAAITAILAASCCVLPFVLFTLGVSSAWIAQLRVLAPYSSWFLGVAIILVLTGAWQIHRKRTARCDTQACNESVVSHWQIAVLALSTVLITVSAFWSSILSFFVN